MQDDLHGRTRDAGRRGLIRALSTAPLWAAPVALLGTGCASRSSIPAPQGGEPLADPGLRVGDTWRYRLTNLYNSAALGETRVEVVTDSTELRLRIDPASGPVTEERYADPWSVRVETTFDMALAFEAPMPIVPPGARAGQRIASATRYRTDRSSRTLAWNQRLHVAGWERVEVPAGSFETLRIDRLIAYEHADPFRGLPERTDVLWYAPRVGRWVRREWTGSYQYAPGGRARALDDRIRWELLEARVASRPT